MLPDPDYGPAGRRESLIRIPVALDIPCEFGSPPGPVGLWQRRVVGARVPEASVNEDGDPSAGESDVSASAAKAVDVNAVIDPIAQSASMQRTP